MKKIFQWVWIYIIFERRNIFTFQSAVRCKNISEKNELRIVKEASSWIFLKHYFFVKHRRFFIESTGIFIFQCFQERKNVPFIYPMLLSNFFWTVISCVSTGLHGSSSSCLLRTLIALRFIRSVKILQQERIDAMNMYKLSLNSSSVLTFSITFKNCDMQKLYSKRITNVVYRV